LRLRLYRRLARVHTVGQVEAMAVELQDRFGPLPEPVSNLLYILRVRVLAADAGLSTLRTEGEEIVAQLPQTISRAVSQAIARHCPDCQARGTHVRLKLQEGWQEKLVLVLQELAQAQ